MDHENLDLKKSSKKVILWKNDEEMGKSSPENSVTS